MLNPKRLVEKAKKWPKLVAASRRGSIKGHFVVYTREGRRFQVPLAYLDSGIFRELFKMSEEEFGLSGDHPITFPCDSVFMEIVVALLQRPVSEDVEQALLNSIVTGFPPCPPKERV